MSAARPRAVALAAVLLLTAALSTGCTSQNKEEPVTTAIPSTPAAGADLVCGMDRADVETAIGLDVGRVEGDLSEARADGTRVCDVWPTDKRFVSGAMLSVELVPASSAEGKDYRAQVDGTAKGVIPPDVAYDGIDGGGWTGAVGGTSVVFVGDQAVVLTSTFKGEGRDPLKDLPALSLQVADSQGLSG
ncbi:hypothetical protein [Cellulomonas sp. HZM]|uniref:hypothetical protein n=1 Tax=Cellulomonas sp. HZM TaxID=1454010 RepID=UPI00049312DC|nr:hypothetical protein [Cellulomonas sp. HZM]